MNWKEVYEKCNHKKYSLITNIKQPARILSTFSIFLEKYKWGMLIGIVLSILVIIVNFHFDIKIILGFIAMITFLTIALIYYNTFKIEVKNDELVLNIMFREITLKKEDLLTIYMEQQKSRIFLVIPFYYYSINILYNNNNKVAGYSLSTIMTHKKDVHNFFKHFEFNVLKKQLEEDEKEEKYRKVVRTFVILSTIVVAIGLVAYGIFSK